MLGENGTGKTTFIRMLAVRRMGRTAQRQRWLQCTALAGKPPAGPLCLARGAPDVPAQPRSPLPACLLTPHRTPRHPTPPWPIPGRAAQRPGGGRGGRAQRAAAVQRELQAAEDQPQVRGHGAAAAAQAHPRVLYPPPGAGRDAREAGADRRSGVCLRPCRCSWLLHTPAGLLQQPSASRRAHLLPSWVPPLSHPPPTSGTRSLPPSFSNRPALLCFVCFAACVAVHDGRDEAADHRVANGPGGAEPIGRRAAGEWGQGSGRACTTDAAHCSGRPCGHTSHGKHSSPQPRGVGQPRASDASQSCPPALPTAESIPCAWLQHGRLQPCQALPPVPPSLSCCPPLPPSPQRVAITLALGQPADIYLIDEPSAYLDSEQRIMAAKARPGERGRGGGGAATATLASPSPHPRPPTPPRAPPSPCPALARSSSASSCTPRRRRSSWSTTSSWPPTWPTGEEQRVQLRGSSSSRAWRQGVAWWRHPCAQECAAAHMAVKGWAMPPWPTTLRGGCEPHVAVCRVSCLTCRVCAVCVVPHVPCVVPHAPG
jgi:hypothetical protein